MTTTIKPSDLIEKGWSQGANARDRDGNIAATDCPEACKFCLYGAMIRCYGLSKAIRVHAEICDKTKIPLISWQDAPERTQEEVVALLRSMGH